MSHFYASIQGNKGEATRQGSANSGITGHIRGWHVGIKVNCYVNDNGEDVCQVSLTSGSGEAFTSKFIGEYTREDLKKD